MNKGNNKKKFKNQSFGISSERVFCFQFCAIILKSLLQVFGYQNLSSDFTLTYKYLSFKFIFYSIGFCKRVLQERVCDLLITQILFYYCYATSELEECIGKLCTLWGCNTLVEGSIVDREILHGGEGGYVEQWLESRNKSSYLRLLSCLYLFAFYSFIIVDLYSSQQDSN